MATILFYAPDHEPEDYRSKLTHPYNYSPILQWQGKETPNASVYTDRLYTWDHELHDSLCQKHFGDKGQYWSDRSPEKIQDFLRERFDLPNLILCSVEEHCNASSGFPVWHLSYKGNRELDPS